MQTWVARTSRSTPMLTANRRFYRIRRRRQILPKNETKASFRREKAKKSAKIFFRIVAPISLFATLISFENFALYSRRSAKRDSVSQSSSLSAILMGTSPSTVEMDCSSDIDHSHRLFCFMQQHTGVAHQT